MTYADILQKFGLPASPTHRDEIRRLLAQEIERERNGGSGEEMLRILCLQLFSLGAAEDSLLIWDAKQSSFDAGCSLDVQFLCGPGLDATRQYLTKLNTESAHAALEYLGKSVESGDFDGWTPQETIADYRRYFGIS
jgi:hypothetical protein